MPESETFADKNVSARYIVKNVLTKKKPQKQTNKQKKTEKTKQKRDSMKS